MKLIEFTVELVGNDVLVNGEPLPKGGAKFNEDMLRKRIHPEHLWALAACARQLTVLLAKSYNEAQVREGEIDEKQAERNLAYMKAQRRQKIDPLMALIRKGGT